MSQNFGIGPAIFPPGTQVVFQCDACGTMFSNLDACPKCQSKKFTSLDGDLHCDVHTDGHANNFGEGEAQ